MSDAGRMVRLAGEKDQDASIPDGEDAARVLSERADESHQNEAR